MRSQFNNYDTIINATEQEIRAHLKEHLNWQYISCNDKLSEQFLEQYKDKIDWDIISGHQHLSIQFIRKYADKLNWQKISLYQRSIKNEQAFRQFQDLITWDNSFFTYYKFSDDFYRQFRDKIYWKGILQHKIPEEKQLEEYKDYLDWRLLSSKQLSEEFLEKHTQKIIWRIIYFSDRQYSKQFRERNLCKVYLHKGETL